MKSLILTCIAAAAAVLVAGLSSQAGATTFTYANAGISNPEQFIDFSGLDDGTIINGTYAGVNFVGLQSFDNGNLSLIHI